MINKFKKLDIVDISDELENNDISKNYKLRSQYMYGIITKTNKNITKGDKQVIPYTLVQYWNDLKSIPFDVQKCIDSWKTVEKYGIKRILFDDKSAKQFIEENLNSKYSEAFMRCGHPAMRSDYFRLCFLKINGGFYIDADDVYKGEDIRSYFFNKKLKVQPLCYDLKSNSMIKISDINIELVDLQKLIFYVNNNPIIAPANHPIINIALERSTKILFKQVKKHKQDIQSTTGPGNLTISLIYHEIKNRRKNEASDFEILNDWDSVSFSQWPLEYRNDNRNWRLWNGYFKEDIGDKNIFKQK